LPRIEYDHTYGDGDRLRAARKRLDELIPLVRQWQFARLWNGNAPVERLAKAFKISRMEVFLWARVFAPTRQAGLFWDPDDPHRPVNWDAAFRIDWWTKEKDDTLSTLWMEQRPVAEIAAALGIVQHAAVHNRRRWLGLPSRRLSHEAP
jgi:hypothetical protein